MKYIKNKEYLHSLFTKLNEIENKRIAISKNLHKYEEIKGSKEDGKIKERQQYLQFQNGKKSNLYILL